MALGIHENECNDMTAGSFALLGSNNMRLGQSHLALVVRRRRDHIEYPSSRLFRVFVRPAFFNKGCRRVRASLDTLQNIRTRFHISAFHLHSTDSLRFTQQLTRPLQPRFSTLLLLLPRLVLQYPPQNLPRRTFRDFLDKSYPPPQLLVVRHLPVHPLDDLRRRSLVPLRAWSRHDVRPSTLGMLFFKLDANDGDI